MALDATTPKPGTMPERYDLGAERDRIVSIAGRGDRLFLLSYRRGPGARRLHRAERSAGVLRADEAAGPSCCRRSRYPEVGGPGRRAASTGMAMCCGR